MKRFIITVDTEGDNLWEWKPGNRITTNNASYTDRFQTLCEQYHFQPVYLINYEMVMDSSFANYISKKAKENKCEIGMHLHAWNSPPAYDLPRQFGGLPYLTEYPGDIQENKLRYLKKLILEKTDIDPVSFRSGRWATDRQLFTMLEKNGFLVDCSVTPGISHYRTPGQTTEHGPSYTGEKRSPYRLYGKLIEVPMTTERIRTIHGKTLKNRARNLLLGKDIWLRPAIHSADEMIQLINTVERAGVNHLELMIHSSELMPGGSPYTRDREDVEKLYDRAKRVFDIIASKTAGITLKDYYEEIKASLGIS